jgi:hypothetical protein
MVAETSVYGGMMYLHGTHMRSFELSWALYEDVMSSGSNKGKSQITHASGLSWAFLLTLTFMVRGGGEYVRRTCSNARRR